MAGATSGLSLSWARVLVAASSALVLVVEIVAGRLLAPYVGVSLDTFTGIIGVILAGIALGAWSGGWLADQRAPGQLLGIAFIAGGLLTWISLPVVAAFGPNLGDGPEAIVMLTALGFFLPSAALSSVPPIVAKMRLHDVARTGSVVGGLSAASTIGALAGTFLTGFVVVRFLPSSVTIIITGAVALIFGVVILFRYGSARPGPGTAMLSVAALALGFSPVSVCEFETEYACVNVVADRQDPARLSLYMNRMRHGFVDLDDPTDLDIRYIRLLAQVLGSATSGPIDTLYLGAGSFGLPRYRQAVEPHGTDTVFEIDDELVDINRSELGLVTSQSLSVRIGDARLLVADAPDGQFDAVVGDAFGGSSVPWHLTTTEMLEQVRRVLRHGGLYAMNLIDAGSAPFARSEAATIREVFGHVAVIVAPEGIRDGIDTNIILVGSADPIEGLRVDPEDGRILSSAEVVSWIGGADVLTDDFAPVDQLIR